MLFDGRNGGTVELLDNVLVIRRKGVASFLTQGLKGEKRIPYSSIRSVQFKEAGFTTGYIQFGIAGGIESRGGVWDATTDENTVLFTKDAAEDFRRLRDIVEDRAAAARHDHAPTSRTAAPQTNVTDELTRLADLRDRGVLTDAEFAEQKTRLLGNSQASPPPPQAAANLGGASAARSRRPPQPVEANPAPKRGFGKTLGIGCLVIIGIFIVLAMIGSQVDTTNASGSAAENATGSAESETAYDSGKAQTRAEETRRETLTPTQANAARSAEQYLSMTGFSRDGLIAQLSSDAGEGYSVADATAAVDSLSVDWKENAVKSARQYLSMSGFSCKALINQLSSRAGEKYTVEQATYGARQAGAC